MKPRDVEVEEIPLPTKSPPPAVSPPDFAIHFASCLEVLDSVVPQPKRAPGGPAQDKFAQYPPVVPLTAREFIVGLLQDSLDAAAKASGTASQEFFQIFHRPLPPLLNGPLALASCLSGGERVGIWRRGGDERHDDELRGLALVNLLDPATTLNGGVRPTFAVLAGASSMIGIVHELWLAMSNGGQQNPRFGLDGKLDSNGPLVLSGLRLSFNEPNQIVMEVTGNITALPFLPREILSMSFVATFIDVITVEDGLLHVRTFANVSVDKLAAEALIAFLPAWLPWVLNLLPLNIPFAVSPLGGLLLPGIWVQAGVQAELDFRVAEATRSVPSFPTVGKSLLSLFPGTFLLPRTAAEKAANSPGRKIQFKYDGAFVGPSAGILAWGGSAFLVAIRVPSVSIVGPDQVAVTLKGITEVKFSITTVDLRPPLTVTWATPNGTKTGAAVNIKFKAGDYSPETVSVTVTDADQNQLSASRQVERISWDPRDDLDPKR